MQFIGVNELDTHDQQYVRGVVGEFVKKFNKLVPNFQELILHLKQYEKEGRAKHSVHVRFIAPKHMKEASADSYVLLDAVHHALEAIEKQLKKMH